jgi:glycosyltransferase involved in cell wall biosynthesis
MDALVSTTHAAAEDIARNLPFSLDRIVVAPIPPDPIFSPGAPDAAALRRLDLDERPFVLFVGQLGRQKNEEGLAAAFVEAKDRGGFSPNARLVYVGDDAAAPAALLRTVGERDDIRLLGSVDDATLLALYRAARGLALPSFFEGYGLPVVEAMACAAPCIVSDTTSLPELGGDAALRVDPADRASIADALSRLFNDDALRAQLSARGLVRARDFSASAMAERHLDAYRMARARHG